MRLVSGLGRYAPSLTMLFSVGSIIGLFALMTLPSHSELVRINPVAAGFLSGYRSDDVIVISNWKKPVQNAQSAKEKAIRHYQFTPQDLDLYRNIYALQADANWSKADVKIAQLKDQTLLADILAERYLSETYDAPFEALEDWLKEYADHPDALRIRRIALRKAPSHHAPLPAVSSKEGARMAYGVRDGMAGRGMPDGWQHALNSWESGVYDAARQSFAAIAARQNLNQWQISAAHFWAYRASIYSHEREQAEQHLREAAQYPFTFYGALAATQLTPGLYKPRFSKVSRDVGALPATRRAAAFVAINAKSKAERELLHLYGQLPPERRSELVSLAAAFSLPALQLRFSQMQHQNPAISDATAYPVPDWLPHYDMQVDPALVYAIIRQESAFNPRAESTAGARGAMQIMPSTASYVFNTNRLGEVKLASLDLTPYNGALAAQDLYKPALNLYIGQNYIRYLSDKPYINGNLVFLLAAYNAGPANLLDWQERFGHIRDPLLFIEKIPFKETREYVQQVMANYLVYQAMLYGKAHSSPALQAGNWPLLPRKATLASIQGQQFASR